jgi:hypothetical protein
MPARKSEISAKAVDDLPEMLVTNDEQIEVEETVSTSK